MNNYFNWPTSLKRFIKFDTARSDDVNDALDEISAGMDDLQLDVNRSIKLPTGTADQTLALGSGARANKILGFDGSGNITVSVNTVDSAAVSAAASAASAVASAASAVASAASAAEAQAIADGMVAKSSEVITATDGQTVFNLTNTYVPGSNSLMVFVNGILMTVGSDYTETSTSSVTFLIGVTEDFKVRFDVLGLSAVGSASATNIGYLPAGTGAVATNVQSKLRESVSVADYLPVGYVTDGSVDYTTQIQTAINTGKDLLFPSGAFVANNLTQSINFQRFYSHGQVNLVKNANGVLITSTGNYVEFDGIQFVGTGYTDHNIVSTGSNPRFINCSSYGAAGRALKATGNHVQILGTCGTYSTTDATASGYDIEIGVSGTATLYHQLEGIYTAQPTGGILLTDTGSHSIRGGQFGKLTIAAGTKPSGVNGGMTSSARILGSVTVEQSSAAFAGNQFAGSIVFASGTSGCRLDTSNTIAAGATIENNGNVNNFIAREVSTGSTTQIKFGPDVSTAVLTISQSSPSTQWQFSGSIALPNTRGFSGYTAGGTPINLASSTAADVASFGSTSWSRTDLNGPFINFNSTSGTQAQIQDGTFRPFSDNTKTLGTASLKWSVVYAGTGTINTSDKREKQDITELDDAEMRVASAIKGMVKKYRFRDAVTVKGDAARIHVGVIAQEVMTAFQVEGLDPMQYGIVCYDEWEAELDKDSVEVLPAGNRYGVRYEELLAFIIAAL